MPINYITSGDIFKESLQALPSFIMMVVYMPTAIIEHENSLGLDCFVMTLVTDVKGLELDIADLRTFNLPEIALH
jgi:hypothetical protein